MIYNPKTERVKVIDMGLCLPQAEHQGWKERQARKTYVSSYVAVTTAPFNESMVAAILG